MQDAIFVHGKHMDPTYAARRAGLCIVAVNCGQAGGTCFCTSMNTGPQATAGFDLALTEVLSAERHDFAVEVGTPRGAELLGELPRAEAGDGERRAAARIVAQTAAHMGRTMDTPRGTHDLLMSNLEHPRWDDVAKRCLTCTNCTLVCPTCFCACVEDTTDLTGERGRPACRQRGVGVAPPGCSREWRRQERSGRRAT